MAYSAANFRVLSGGINGMQTFRYKTTDLLSVVVASGYFDDAVDDYNLNTGDVIIITTGAVGAAAVDLLVATNTTGTVTVVNGS